MKNKEQKKYPMDLFFMGLFMDIFIRHFYLFIPAVILMIIGIWVKVCLIIGIVLLGLDIIIALVEQIGIRSALINNENPEIKDFQNAILSDDWMKNVGEVVEARLNSSEENKS